MNNKKGQVGIGTFIMVLIVVLLGVTFLEQVANDNNLMTATQSYSEQINVSTAFINASAINTSKVFYVTQSYTGADAFKTGYGSECNIAPTIVNVTGTTYVTTTDVVKVSDGSFTLVNTSNVVFGGQLLNLSYTYCADGYNKDSSSRTMLGLNVIFGAIIIFAGVLYYFKDSLSDIFG